jgi:hypothetical protein
VKRKVKVDLAELALALDMNFYETRHYLDLETGKVLSVSDEISRELEDIYEQIYDQEGTRVVPLEQYLETREGPEWQKEALLEADQVEQGYGERYIQVEKEDPYEDYNDMERFVAYVEDPDLSQYLGRAIRGRGAFGRFKGWA